MMMFHGEFCLKREYNEVAGMYYVLATDTYTTEGYKLNGARMYPITTLKEFRNKFKGVWCISFFCAIVSLFLLAVCCSNLAKIYVTGTLQWYNFFPLGITFAISFLYIRQAVRSRVYDLAGHWVSLWNGRTNIDGGCVIRKK